MIDSPEQQFDDIRHSVCDHESRKILFYTNLPPELVIKKTENAVRANAIVSYFVRMSWVNKLKFLTCLFNKIKDLQSLTLLLNTLHLARGKLSWYSKSSNSTPSDYDRQIYDHDRMFEPNVLTEVVRGDMLWFASLDEKEQVAFVVTIIRSGGGALTREIYKRLQMIYAHRLNETSSTLQSPRHSETKEKHKSVELLELQHDPQDPKHQKVLKLTKEWNETMTKLKRNVQKMQLKANPPKEETKKEKKKKSKTTSSKSKESDKKGGKKKKKGKKKKEEECLDWLQLTPIPIVKRIFNFLDAASLRRAKQVNEYWKWAVGEFLKDKKVSKLLEKTKIQLKTASGCDQKSSECQCPKEPEPRVSHTEKRLLKLKERGTVIEELRFKHLEATDCYSLAVEALKKTGENLSYLENISMYPRVPRGGSPLYKKPDYIIKDYELIREEVEDEFEDVENVISFFSSSLSHETW